MQYDPVKGGLLHVDFYQVNLREKVTVPIPIVLVGEEPEIVHLGEGTILQTLNEVEVEALPTDLIEHFEVDISKLVNLEDAITVDQLEYDRETLTVLAEADEQVVKLAPVVIEVEEEPIAEEAAEEGAEAAAEGGEAEESGESDQESSEE